MRLIDADALLDEICREECERKYKDCDYTCSSVATVVNAPTVLPKTARLIDAGPGFDDDGNDTRVWRCSECNRGVMSYEKPKGIKYCIECGAKFEGGASDDH